MKKYLSICLNACILLSCYFLMTLAYATHGISNGIDSPIGYWKTIDDATGQPKALVQIWEASDQTLRGKIVKVFNPAMTNNPNAGCSACAGKQHNKPLVGLTVLEHLEQNKEKPNEWLNGAIFDPKNGKTYKCNIRLTDKGQKLHVRGFIGLPLFGRSQTWLKASKSNV